MEQVSEFVHVQVLSINANRVINEYALKGYKLLERISPKAISSGSSEKLVFITAEDWKACQSVRSRGNRWLRFFQMPSK